MSVTLENVNFDMVTGDIKLNFIREITDDVDGSVVATPKRVMLPYDFCVDFQKNGIGPWLDANLPLNYPELLNSMPDVWNELHIALNNLEVPIEGPPQ